MGFKIFDIAPRSPVKAAFVLTPVTVAADTLASSSSKLTPEEAAVDATSPI